jgi:hypothetical protein
VCVANKAEIANSVLSYLTSNADASDTLEGITEWWLLEQNIKQNINEIREVLVDLTTKKLIIAYKAADTRVHYRINRRKQRQIRALLKDKD